MIGSNGIIVQHHQTGDPPTEESIRSLTESQGQQFFKWSNQAGDYYPAHFHSFHKRIWVIRGEITFNLPELSKKITLREGDRMELPANILHEAKVGKRGVTCLECHL